MTRDASLALAAALVLASGSVSAQPSPSVSATTTYHTAEVDGLHVFYREAGPKDAPTLVLLHGFPSSSAMFATLIPLLADRYHVVAPDYPGFGLSDAPPPSQIRLHLRPYRRVRWTIFSASWA